MLSRDWLRQHARIACLIAFAAGAGLVAAFAPIGVYPFALVCPAVLAWLWVCSAQPGHSAWVGFAFGMGLSLAGVYWVCVSLSMFGGMPMPLAALATVLYCAFLAWPLALTGYLQHKVPAGEALRLTCLIPALWLLAEMARGVGVTGFPWLLLGYASTDTPLAGSMHPSRGCTACRC